MTATPEQIAQVRLAADIMDKGWEWEWQATTEIWYPGGKGFRTPLIALACADTPIRRKQPAPIPLDRLRALCGGQEPHRPDWTEDMLPKVTDGGLPWRPLCKGEETPDCAESESKDDYSRDGIHWTSIVIKSKEEGWQVGSPAHLRTRRPAPAAFWDCAEDVPGPVCFLRRNRPEKEGSWSMIISAGSEGVQIACDQGTNKILTWAELHDYVSSPDRRNWRPCLKEGKAS